MRLQPGLTSIQLLTAVIQLLTTVPNDLGAHSLLVPNGNESFRIMLQPNQARVVTALG